MQIDAKASPEFRAAILAMRSIDRTISKMVRQHVKRIAAPEWTKALAKRANTAVQRRVIVNTAVITVSNQNVPAQSASKGRPLSGGLNPKTDYAGFEFGVADRNKTATYQRKGHPVTRRTRRQMPARNTEGYVFWPAAREMVARLGRLYVQTVYRTIANATEGKQE